MYRMRRSDPTNIGGCSGSEKFGGALVLILVTSELSPLLLRGATGGGGPGRGAQHPPLTLP